jgi:hypothetical protein
MKHFISALLGFWMVVGLVACQSPTPQATPTQPEPTATATPEDTPAPTKEPASGQPVPTPTISWQIPEIRPDEWTRGGADAGLVLVEYSDFQ